MAGGVARKKTRAALKPGDRVGDGTIYAGVSPDTGKPMYTTTGDAFLIADDPVLTQWTQAVIYAERMTSNGHHDWRLPSSRELNMLFNNRAAIRGFKLDRFGS